VARPTSWAATKRRIVTLPVSGSTSTSQNWVEKPGAMPPALTEAAAVIGPPVSAFLAASSLNDIGWKSPTLLLAGLAWPSSRTTLGAGTPVRNLAWAQLEPGSGVRRLAALGKQHG